MTSTIVTAYAEPSTPAQSRLIYGMCSVLVNARLAILQWITVSFVAQNHIRSRTVKEENLLLVHVFSPDS